jgi:hypothetical protein
LFWPPEGRTMPHEIDSNGGVMPAAAAKQKRKMFHANVIVTRIEEWCVEAETAEEARKLLTSGDGHRCHFGDRIHAEVQNVIDD